MVFPGLNESLQDISHYTTPNTPLRPQTPLFAPNTQSQPTKHPFIYSSYSFALLLNFTHLLIYSSYSHSWYGTPGTKRVPPRHSHYTSQTPLSAPKHPFSSLNTACRPQESITTAKTPLYLLILLICCFTNFHYLLILLTFLKRDSRD